jgi:hypothetical protein
MTDYIRDLRLAKWGSGAGLHGGNPGPLMSALGQKQTLHSEIGMSALPPKADIGGVSSDVRFVPKADNAPAPKAWRHWPRSFAPHRGIRNLRQSHHSHIVWPI